MSKKTVTIDLDAFRNYLDKVSKKNGGLETSSGITPSELDRCVEVIQDLLRDSGQDEFSDALNQVFRTIEESHERFCDSSEDD